MEDPTENKNADLIVEYEVRSMSGERTRCLTIVPRGENRSIVRVVEAEVRIMFPNEGRLEVAVLMVNSIDDAEHDLFWVAAMDS